MDHIATLRGFPLLSNIQDGDLKILSGMLKERHTKTGENVITEGESGDEMFVLVEGTVDVIKSTIFGDKFVVATLDAKSHCVFGEMALIDNDKRSATVKAKTDCTTLSIARKDFDRFCNEHPRSGVELLKLISTNLVRNIRTENNNLRMVYQALIEEIEMG
ncbi:MAG: cyclic nucleotide-binding domain-containing protein [Lachnospiraceae bacterium]|nr:cyclic nucleotide-binding domain-containing protein [Lachnospiraceae bacterium]